MGFFSKFFSIGGRKAKGKKKIHDGELEGWKYQPAEPQKMDRQRLQPVEQLRHKDPDVAAARLLRSSSAHFSVVSEVDYTTLPPIPHPINTITKSTISSAASRTPSVQTRSTYTVKVLERQILSLTEFPYANPSLRDSLLSPTKNTSDRQRPIEHKSTPNLHEQKTKLNVKTPRRRQVSDPRKIPFTPRDKNRLNKLRQDPSVVSLLNMYDDKGRLDEHAFSNTPPKAVINKRSRRESTFKELLRTTYAAPDEFDEGEGDLSWADRYIAGSNASTSSLSTISSPEIPTPVVTQFDSLNGGKTKIHGDTTYCSDASTAHPTFSSLEVELSVTTDEAETTIVKDATTCCTPPSKKSLSNEPASPNKIHRTPSQRASQVFNFLSEKRERRRSQGADDLLVASTATNKQSTAGGPPHDQMQQQNQVLNFNLDSIHSRLEVAAATTGASKSTSTRASSAPKKVHRAPVKYDVPEILVDEYVTPDVTTASPIGFSSEKLSALALPTPRPVSAAATLMSSSNSRMLPPPLPPRQKASSTGAVEVRVQEQSNGQDQYQGQGLARDNGQGIRRGFSRGSTGAVVVLETSNGREKGKERAVGVRGPRPLPKLPPVSTNASSSSLVPDHAYDSDRFARPILGEVTNVAADYERDYNHNYPTEAYSNMPTRTTNNLHQKRKFTFGGEPRRNPHGADPIANGQYAPLIVSGAREGKYEGKINSGDVYHKHHRPTGDGRKALKGSELIRSVTATKYEKVSQSSSIPVPMTPSRSRSLVTAPSPASSSELSPETKQMMSDLRQRRMLARQFQRERDGSTSRSRHVGA